MFTERQFQSQRSIKLQTMLEKKSPRVPRPSDEVGVEKRRVTCEEWSSQERRGGDLQSRGDSRV